jgi:protein-S-isoprenylcysteine O-methyltransferase Ste14
MTRATDTAEGDVLAASPDAPLIKRAAVLLYGIGSYGLGVTALVAWIISMLGLLPFTGGPIHLTGANAVIFNLALMIAFGLQHSVMARPAFKDKWTKFISPAIERSTFVLATGLFLGPIIFLWQPMPMTIWKIENVLFANTTLALAVAGWTYLFLATFAINHFELFGLRQVYQYALGKAVTAVPFKERFMYRFDRHPIMTGAVMGMWLTPHLQLDHLLFAAFATLYIVIGVYFEERSLRRRWGATYDDYCDRTHSIIPTLPRR